MRVRALMVIAMAEGMSAWAAQPATVPGRSVIVCLETETDGWVRSTAGPETSKIFAQIGVRIEWGPDTPACRRRGAAIVIRLSYRTPATLQPRAWAYALPFEGTHIVVFYDRVQD